MQRNSSAPTFASLRHLLRLSLGALAAAALAPPTARAQSWPAGRPIIVTDLTDPRTPTFSVRLVLQIAADDSARVGGTIRLGRGARRRVLVATRQAAQVTFGDADGDGVVGLARMSATFRDARTRARVPVSLSPTGGDIDASGAYAVALRVGRRAVSGEVFVKLPGPEPSAP